MGEIFILNKRTGSFGKPILAQLTFNNLALSASTTGEAKFDDGIIPSLHFGH
jgi:hypothetical protein